MRGGELLEKRRLQTGEFADRREFDHGLHLTFEQHGQDDIVAWESFEKCGTESGPHSGIS